MLTATAKICALLQ